jgi:hypothetical protein
MDRQKTSGDRHSVWQSFLAREAEIKATGFAGGQPGAPALNSERSTGEAGGFYLPG